MRLLAAFNVGKLYPWYVIVVAITMPACSLWATRDDVKSELETNTRLLCGQIPGCSGTRIPVSDLRDIAPGWYATAIEIRPKQFVDESGLPVPTACSKLLTTSIVKKPEKEDLDSTERHAALVAALRSAETPPPPSLSPFGSPGVFYKIAASELNVEGGVRWGATGFAAHASDGILAAQIWVKESEESVAAPPDPDRLRRCCEAYGCGSGKYVSDVAHWRRFKSDLSRQLFDTSMSYVVEVAKFKEQMESASIDAGTAYNLVKLTQVAPPTKSSAVCDPSPVRVLSTATGNSLTIKCANGFTLQPSEIGGGRKLDVTGSGSRTKVTFIGKFTEGVLQQHDLTIVPTEDFVELKDQSPGTYRVEFVFVADANSTLPKTKVYEANQYVPEVPQISCGSEKDDATVALSIPSAPFFLGRITSAFTSVGDALVDVRAHVDVNRLVLRCQDIVQRGTPACGKQPPVTVLVVLSIVDSVQAPITRTIIRVPVFTPVTPCSTETTGVTQLPTSTNSQ